MSFFKDLLRSSGKLFSRYAIGVVMCLIVYASFIFAITAGFSDTVGHRVMWNNPAEEGPEKQVCIHDLDENPIDEDGNLLTEHECKKYNAEELNNIPITELSDSRHKIALALSQIFSFVLLTGILAGTMWEMGNKDLSAVKLGRKSENKLRGLYIGLLAAVPSFIIFLLLVLSGVGVFSPKFLNIYNGCNYHFYYLIYLIYSGATDASQLSAGQFALCGALNLYLPIMSFISYYLGYIDINLIEKITFSKKARYK